MYKLVKREFGAHCDEVKPGEMLVFVAGGEARAVEFLCPCGCGRPVYLPVGKPGSTTVWQFDEAAQTVTPSVRWRSGCKTHFEVKGGEAVVHGQ